MGLNKVSLIALFFVVAGIHAWTPSVDIKGLGKVKGTTQKTYLTKRDYAAYLGMPYAHVTERFLPATEATRLTSDGSVFDASKPQQCCPQPPNAVVPTSSNTVEDCLTLNVFAPVKMPWDKPRPVIVYLHGGSFYRWSGNMYDGRRLLERDVVVVTINYRLGVLGFFCLGNDGAPGNAGMYDMVHALHWVQKHISAFGGDPNKVTIAGQSAGGAAVTWLLDSPLSRGLYRNAIALSGDDIDVWAVNPAPVANSLQAAQIVGCLSFVPDANGQPTAIPNMPAILACMKAVPAAAMNFALPTFFPAPAVQTFNLSIPKFAPVSPMVSLAAGLQNPVPLIIGTTKNDGSFLLSRFYSSTIAPQHLDQNPAFLQYQLMPMLYQSFGLVDNPPGYFASLTSTYLGDAATSGNWNAMVPGLIDIFSVIYFKMGAFQTANYHSALNPNTYLYSFDYFGNNTYYPYIGGVPQIPKGVAHVDDVMYLFELDDFNRLEDYMISFALVNAWANFATTNDPNKYSESDEPMYPTWPKWDLNTHEFVKINVIPTEGDNYQAYWVGASNGIQG